MIICITYNCCVIFSLGWLGNFKDTNTNINTSQESQLENRNNPHPAEQLQLKMLCAHQVTFSNSNLKTSRIQTVTLSNIICSVCLHKHLCILQEVRTLDDHDTVSKEKLRTTYLKWILVQSHLYFESCLLPAGQRAGCRERPGGNAGSLLLPREMPRTILSVPVFTSGVPCSHLGFLGKEDITNTAQSHRHI